ncbi:alpha/beta hydrolase family protein [Tunturiibacter lichenicola]|uniref:alpha/beta hydrolase family protein n=1 Tax=Tunturiibacter lichenicola TaxID=2051959 RepID=UPI0021B1E62A|nr:acetylxylan esterase [Edaphobacter lichenicola]
MPEIRPRHLLVLLVLFSTALAGLAQRTTRTDPTDLAHPFNTPSPVSTPATDEQFAQWREQAKAALFLSKDMPPVAARDFGSFTPLPGVIAHRVTYGTQFGMRVPAIVYRPDHVGAKLPAIVVVAGHGGSKSTWYEVYAGLLYASAGAVVVTYDPIGEEERNSQHLVDARAHDTVLPGLNSPARMGGLMIGDVIDAVSYAASLPEVDSKRIAVIGYSMGSFHAALAAGLDPRIRALVLSGGGDLDGNGGSWDTSSKIMCQGGPYQALSFLPDKSAILYALHQRTGETLVLNGLEDNLVTVPHHGDSFFVDLNARVSALAGPTAPKIEYRFYPGVGHRPSWVNRDAAAWLNERLHFPRWQNISLDSLGETTASEWAAATGAHINHGFESDKSEGGIRALGHGFPAPTRAQLQVVPEGEWLTHQDLYIWQSWAKRALLAEGLPADPPEPAPPRASTTGDPNVQPTKSIAVAGHSYFRLRIGTASKDPHPVHIDLSRHHVLQRCQEISNAIQNHSLSRIYDNVGSCRGANRLRRLAKRSTAGRFAAEDQL